MQKTEQQHHEPLRGLVNCYNCACATRVSSAGCGVDNWYVTIIGTVRYPVHHAYIFDWVGQHSTSANPENATASHSIKSHSHKLLTRRHSEGDSSQ